MRFLDLRCLRGASIILVATALSTPLASEAASVPLKGAVRIDAGYEFACALLANGGVECWGKNDDGQLGDGFPLTFRPTSRLVSGLSSGVTAIGLGATHACAILNGGAVKCWGGNASGQLGNGTSGGNEPLPVDVAGLGGAATALALGYRHTCALMVDKTVRCWGDALGVGHGAASPQVTPLGHDVNNVKISVKLAVLIAILVIAFINRKRETVAAWVLPVIGGLTVVNILLATVWR